MSTAISSGQSPPLYTITSEDQAGTIVIVTGLCLVIAVTSLFVRTYVLLQTGRARLHWDDCVIGVALFFAVIQTSLVQQEAAKGLGRTIKNVTSDEAEQIQHLQFVDRIFFILSVWTSKLSTALFFYRLSPKLHDHSILKASMALIVLTGTIGLLMLCLVCDLSRPWQYFTSQGVICTAPYHRWVAVYVMDIVTEAALAASAVKIVWPLQMTLKSKAAIGFVFIQRLAILAPIVARLHYLSATYHSDNPTLHGSVSTICKEVEIAFGIVAASIPCFRPFLIATATNYGAPVDGGTLMGSQDQSASKSYKLSKLRGNRPSKNPSHSTSINDERRPLPYVPPRSRSQFTAVVSGGPNTRRDTASIESDDSSGMIIRKNINYDVRYCEAGVVARDPNSL